MSIIITMNKELLGSIKNARDVYFRFGANPTIEIYSKEDRNYCVTVNAEPGSNIVKQTGFWHTGSYDWPLLLQYLKPGDQVMFKIMDNTNDEMRQSGYLWYMLSAHIQRYNKDGKWIRTIVHNVNSMVAPSTATNFKDMVLRDAY